jgi:hypothetical protein
MVLLVAYPAFRFSWLAYYLLNYPFQVDYGEGPVLNSVVLLATQGNYFFDISNPPYVFGAYPPLFSLLCLPLYFLFGPALAVTRAVSIIATLSIAGVLYLLLKTQTKDRLYSLIFALLFFGASFVQEWGSYGRVDTLACFFSVLGLYLFLRSQGHERLRYCAFFSFVAAFFTKHNAVSAPLAVFLYVFFTPNERKYLGRYLAGYFIPLTALFLVLCAYTNGEFYKHLFIYSSATGVDFENLLNRFYSQEFLVYALVLLSSLALGFYEWRNTKKGPSLLFLIYLALCTVSLLSVAKRGASFSYFIEPYLSALVFSAIAFKKRPIFYPYLVVLAAVISFQFWNMPINNNFQDSSTPRNKALAVVYDLVARQPGPVLSNDITAVLRAGKQMVVDPYIFSYLAMNKVWNERPLIQKCQEKQFSLIILNHQLSLMPGIPECLMKSYRLIGLPDYGIYIPTN